MSEEEKSIIIKMHKENKNTVEIAKYLSRSQSTIERFLKKNGYKMNYGRRLSDSQLNKVKTLYLSGMTCKQIYQLYSDIYTSEEAIQNIVRKLGVSRGHYSKPVVLDHHYFHTIDNERKAYWLGLLLADGSVIHYKHKSDVIKLELNVQDKYIIDMFANDIKTDLSVKDYQYRKKHNATLSVRSNIMSNDLAKYGMVYNKTLILSEVPNIDKSLFRHLLRGYFDGDGCIYTFKPNDQNLLRARITICGTKNFLLCLQQRINEDLNIGMKQLVDMNKYGSNVFNLVYTKNKDIVSLYYYMYKDATVFLTRKKNKFDNFFKQRSLTKLNTEVIM